MLTFWRELSNESEQHAGSPVGSLCWLPLLVSLLALHVAVGSSLLVTLLVPPAGSPVGSPVGSRVGSPVGSRVAAHAHAQTKHGIDTITLKRNLKR